MDYEVKKCLPKTEQGKISCDCLSRATTNKEMRICLSNAIYKGYKVILFGNMCSGKSTTWRKLYADPEVCYRGNVEKRAVKELDMILDEGLDEEGRHYLARKMFTSHNNDHLIGSKEKNVFGLGKTIVLLMERDIGKITKCLMDEREWVKERLIKSGKDPKNMNTYRNEAIGDKAYFRNLAEESFNDVIILENKNGDIDIDIDIKD